MKTIKIVLISLAMSILFNNIALANNYIPVLKVEAGVAKKFYLALENVSAATSIKIQDREGFTLVEEQVAATERFEKIFNLENLQSGEYKLVIKSSYKETIQPIVVTTRTLIVDERKRQEFYPAIIMQAGQNVNLSLLNPTKSQVTLSIFGRTGEVVYRETLKDLVVVEKSYDLSQIPAGEYTVVVNTSHDVYSHEVTLR